MLSNATNMYGTNIFDLQISQISLESLRPFSYIHSLIQQIVPDTSYMVVDSHSLNVGYIAINKSHNSVLMKVIV